MDSIMCVYDLPEALKIANPSAKFRRYGFRVNLSCWVFPQHLVPSDDIDNLRAQGATVHLVEFAVKAQDKILDLARAELRRHCTKIVEIVKEKCKKARQCAERNAHLESLGFPDENDLKTRWYKSWRAIISKGRRELVCAEQCAIGFTISGDVRDALDSLKSVLESELSLALAYRDQLHQQERLVPA